MDARSSDLAQRWQDFVWDQKGASIPHCDSNILHKPGICAYCDRHPDWQAARLEMGIAYTGNTPLAGQAPCPADASRPANSGADHRRWAGNKPTSADGNPEWPVESFASQVMYGDKGGRTPWPLAERIRLRLLRPYKHFKMRRRGFKLIDGLWISND